jgi:hypothetical protein
MCHDAAAEPFTLCQAASGPLDVAVALADCHRHQRTVCGKLRHSFAGVALKVYFIILYFSGQLLLAAGGATGQRV